MRIGSTDITRFSQPYVIAELGVNHDGSVALALEMTRAAARAGASAVKLQYFEAERLMSRDAELAPYQAKAGETDPRAMLRRLEMPLADMARVVSLAHELGLHAIVTVFSTELVPGAARLGWDAFKTASPDIINWPLLRALAGTGLPLIVSTGAARLEEVARALAWLRTCRERLALLQCVSDYPAREEDASLGGMAALAALTDAPVGYSDHTQALDTGALAVAAGATVLEKHLTYDRRASGPDHSASVDEAGLAEYVRLARRAHVMLGGRAKQVLEREEAVRRVSRQSLAAARDGRAGEAIVEADLTCARPGTGMAPELLETLIGRRWARDVRRGSLIREADVQAEERVPERQPGHGAHA